MKNLIQNTLTAAFFLALLLPQLSYGQSLNVGDNYEDGILFQVNSGGESLICQTRDLGSMDWADAVAACKRLGNGWRLPTKDELNLMYINLHKRGNGDFEDDLYWSSSDQGDRTDVWDQDFSDGDPNFGGKEGFDEYVRAVKEVSLKKKINNNNRPSSVQLKIGGTHNGGIVFSMDNSGQKGLICQKSDLGDMDWNQAIAACKQLGDGWRLPTKDELNLMYLNLHKKRKGTFIEDFYWSSSDQGNRTEVWDQNFDNGRQNFGGKVGFDEYVRAVKGFSLNKQTRNTNTNTNTNRQTSTNTNTNRQTSTTTRDESKNIKNNKPRNSTSTRSTTVDNFSGNKGTFKDSRDGQSYKWLRMKDGKIWMAENLNFNTKDAFCYNDQEKYCANYGRIYKWDAAEFACPSGWSLPHMEDWKEMRAAEGKDLSKKEASRTLRKGGKTGFSEIFGGWLQSNGTYRDKGQKIYYWTATEKGSPYAYYSYYWPSHDSFNYQYVTKAMGATCRCIKD